MLQVLRAKCFSRPCQDFFDLSYGLLRHPAIDAGSSPISDSLLVPGWYRVRYSTMTKTRQPINRCGTTYPIWLNGSDPTEIKAVKSLYACQVGPGDDPCQKKYYTRAMRCPNNDVIYLLDPPVDGDAAYCFESIDDCVKEPVDSVEVIYYNTTWVKKQSSNYQEYYDPVLNFYCNFTPLKNGSLYYNVQWYIGDSLVNTYNIDENSTDHATFSSEDMLSVNRKMGEKIRCAVGAKLSQNSSTCTLSSSLPFTVGFEILNSTINLQRNGKETIVIKQNIPYVTKSDHRQQYQSILNIHTKFKDTNTVDCQPLGKPKKCTISIDGVDYVTYNQLEQNQTWEIYHEFQIYSLDSLNYYIPNQRLLLSLGTSHTPDENVFFSDVDFPDIHINVVEDIETWKGKKCSSYADPHMTTFDGHPYECQSKGCISNKTYILYRNQRHTQEAQVRHGDCWGDPRCICAVAARSGRDVFIIDFCHEREFIDFPNCDDQSLQVLRDEDLTYRIIFPTGKTMKVYIYEEERSRFWYLNVEIYPTIADFKSVDGLCGFFDGDRDNDLRRRNGQVDSNSLYPDEFSNSWRVDLTNESSETDLLSHDTSIYNNLPKLNNYTQKLCHCNENGTICSYHHYQDCKTSSWGPKLACILHNNKRKERDITAIQQMYCEQKDYQRSEVTYPKRYKRATSKSQDEATFLCVGAFENTAHYKTCLLNIPNFSNETLLNCINDLMMTGNENLTKLHVETALAQCKEYISYNSSLQTEQPTIAYSILALCSKNCSNNGMCNEGICTCFKGFGGSDCSFDISSPPIISRISDNGLCDKTTEPCDEVTIYGKYFVTNPNASCSMKRTGYNTSGMSSYEEMYQAKLMEKTLFEASCALVFNDSESWFSKFLFRLTNDGEQFTEEHTVYVYQSKCQIFKNESGTITFSLQENYCFIKGVCVPEGKWKTPSSCLICDPQTDVYNWVYGSKSRLRDSSSSCTISNPEETNTNDMNIIAIVGGCVGFIIIVVIVFLGTCSLKQKITKRKTDNMSRPCEASFNIYPDRLTVSKQTFDPKANLFSFPSTEEKYSRPPSAVSLQRETTSVDLRKIYQSQNLDSLFTTKKE